METLITTVESSVHPPSSTDQSWKLPQKVTTHDNSHRLVVLQKEIAHLEEVIGEKNAQIKRVTGENEFLHAELERLHNRMQTEVKRSDELIDQMQTAADESSKQAYTIIMHLSQQVERQTEEIAILQESQGLRGVIRDLKSKLPVLGMDSIKRALQPRLSRG